MSLKLTKADIEAISARDADYINDKGVTHYRDGEYEYAIEYYRIAAAMGNRIAVSNLGYCYLYRRSVEKNVSLAMSYFKIAADRGVVDANYKLGSIYANGDEGVKRNRELSIYYYQKAATIVFRENMNPQNYPSLFFALAKEHMPKGKLYTDIRQAYVFLKIAEEGYTEQLLNGEQFREAGLNSVRELLANPIFRQYKQEDTDDGNEFLPN